MRRAVSAAFAALVLAAGLAGCSNEPYDGAVKQQQSEAAAKLDAAIAQQKAVVASEPWASDVTKLSLDATGTKLYILTTLGNTKADQETGKAVCRGYAPAVANFPDISVLIVGDSSNTEIARCAIERKPEGSTSVVESPTTGTP